MTPTLRLFAALALLAGTAARALPPVPPDGPTGPPVCTDAATIKLSSSASEVTFPNARTLTWSLSAPVGCKGLSLELDSAAVPAIGSRTDRPPRTEQHALRLMWTGLGQRALLRTVRVTVVVRYPTRMSIDAGTARPVQALVGALDPSNLNPMQVIELCNVDLDLTGHANLMLTDNRSLVAAPGCERGARSLGPRIFVTDKRGPGRSLFLIRSDKVKIAGFRLEGPTAGIGDDDDNNVESAIRIWPFGTVMPTPITSIVVSNMEISKWSGIGVEVGDAGDGALPGRFSNQTVGAVRISGNYFHHNRHRGKEGYGVLVTGGGYALIERNVFEENRHAIAGGSWDGRGDFSGYTARENLVLPGGGLHCGFAGICWQTHQIDMHGDRGHFDSDWCCGRAGETLMIERNTLLYTGGYRTVVVNGQPTQVWSDGLAIKVRGNPIDKAVVAGNVFRHGSRDDAIAQNGALGIIGDNISNPIDVRPDNVFGADPMATLGQCDFAGDGRQDSFMASGVTWWARSPVTQQWRFLNAQPQKLAQLMFADVNGDGRCDVVLKPQAPATQPGFYSSGGMGAWTMIGANAP
ncbi:right-handed parallel beta-helix repeat-containing protein [Aquincola sp. S2]|uniref:Right-handed parallel beta-helix repeat-containing protein n=1 Tax=Pseudaquabacterium terrae TaxID=2732868 RepID=A0ABX2ERW9_9BURK|nr:right-handed parallel beta-helix repeat-containing protein [Aquabacterium terrae]NRF71434.1 right-handed parallel beta-helix repeat-containing protein [Aquabacterium terrae]